MMLVEGSGNGVQAVDKQGCYPQADLPLGCAQCFDPGLGRVVHRP